MQLHYDLTAARLHTARRRFGAINYAEILRHGTTRKTALQQVLQTGIHEQNISGLQGAALVVVIRQVYVFIAVTTFSDIL